MFLTGIVFAQTLAENTEAGKLLKNIVGVIVNPIITLFFIMALVVFVYGVFEFIRGADNEEARKLGQKHMIYGVLGLFIMTAAFGLITILSNLVGDIGGTQAPNFWIIK